MERTAVNAATARPSNNDGNPGPPAVPALCGKVRDLIESARNKIGELHFGDGTHPHECGADSGSYNSRLGYRCVDDAPLTEPFEHSSCNLERAAVNPNIFAENEHPFVLFHFFPDTLANRFNVSGQSHAA